MMTKPAVVILAALLATPATFGLTATAHAKSKKKDQQKTSVPAAGQAAAHKPWSGSPGTIIMPG